MLSINRRKKYQTGKTPEQIHAETVARETAQLQVANSYNGNIQQAENMVLGSYQQPQQVFSDVAPVQNPQYLSEFTSNMVYAPTLSQYMGSDVPMKLALSNLKTKEDKAFSDFATTGVTGKDVLNPDLGYREKLLKGYNDEITALSNNSTIPPRQKYKEAERIKNKYNNDLGLQRLYQNKKTRDEFAKTEMARTVGKDADLTPKEAMDNIARYDKRYADQLGAGEDYSKGYDNRNFAAIFNNEKFVNDALAGIEIDGVKTDISGGWYSGGMYFYKDKNTGERKEISPAKVYKALEGAITNNALLQSRIGDEAELYAEQINPDSYKAQVIAQATKSNEELAKMLNDPKLTAEQKTMIQQNIDSNNKGLQLMNNADANGIREFAKIQHSNKYIQGLKDNASKKIKLETMVGKDQDIFGDTWNQWLGKRGIIKGDEAEERERLKRENQIVPIQGAEGKELNLPTTLEEYGKSLKTDKSEYTAIPVGTGIGAQMQYLYKGKAISKEEFEKGKQKEVNNNKLNKPSSINLADKLANEDNIFRGLYDYQLRNGKGTAKERANEAYKQYLEEKKKYTFNNGITISNRTQAKNLADAIQQGDLAGTTKDGLPIMTWLDKQAKELGLTTEDGKSITSGIGLLDNMGKSMLFNPYTQEVTINVRGKQLSVPATNNMKAEMQILKDLKNSRETGNPVNTVWRLGELQISGQAVTDYSRGTANTMFIPNPQNQYELNEVQKIQNQIPNYDISKGIPLNIIDAMYQKKSQTTGFGGTTDQDNTGNTQTKIINYDKYDK